MKFFTLTVIIFLVILLYSTLVLSATLEITYPSGEQQQTSYNVTFALKNTGPNDIDLSKVNAFIDEEQKNIEGNTGSLAPNEIKVLNITNVANPCGKKLKILIYEIIDSKTIAC